MARHHGFGCAQQMQGQMHVHGTEMAPPVPLLGHFFCHLPDVPARGPDLFPVRTRWKRVGSFRFRNRTSTARSVLVADFGP
ncbi:hypothetical protein C3492_26040 [Streptomyces sp. Ru62]|nr:hypothetical protein C3492_26040 [Streptomyces sp. Ru62]